MPRSDSSAKRIITQILASVDPALKELRSRSANEVRLRRLRSTTLTDIFGAAALESADSVSGLAEAMALCCQPAISAQLIGLAHERWPNDATPARQLIELSRGLGTSTLTERLLEWAAPNFPRDRQFCLHGIRAAERDEDWELALSLWQEFRANFPDDLSADFGEAAILERLGAVDAANAILGASFRRAQGTSDTNLLTDRPPRGNRAPTSEARTIVFCTSYAHSKHHWTTRYRRWVDAIHQSDLNYSQVLLVDDGSPELPDWPDLRVFCSISEYDPRAPLAMFHFDCRLGRHSMCNYPGWYRSFGLPAKLAALHPTSRLFHIESDAFVISDRLSQFFNGFCDGWATMWPATRGVPETGIQLIAGKSLNDYRDFVDQPYAKFVDSLIEMHIPVTYLAKEFKGDRYGEDLNYVPWDADWTTQSERESDTYYWWLDPVRSRLARPPHSGTVAAPRLRRGSSLRADEALLRQSILFDAEFYRSKYADVVASHTDPVAHFCRYGWREHRNPSKWFDTAWYIASYGETMQFLRNPLVHYLEEGESIGYQPNAYLQPLWYRYFAGIRTDESALAHFVNQCMHGCTLKSFDTDWYLSSYKDVAEAGVPPFEHYVRFGIAEGRLPRSELDIIGSSGLFDSQYYLAKNPDVLAAGVDPLSHFCTSGWREGRRPIAEFHTEWYGKRYITELSHLINPLVHFILYGEFNGLNPNPEFDIVSYKKRYKLESGQSALHHYIANSTGESDLPRRKRGWQV